MTRGALNAAVAQVCEKSGEQRHLEWDGNDESNSGDKQLSELSADGRDKVFHDETKHLVVAAQAECRRRNRSS